MVTPEIVRRSSLRLSREKSLEQVDAAQDRSRRSSRNRRKPAHLRESGDSSPPPARKRSTSAGSKQRSSSSKRRRKVLSSEPTPEAAATAPVAAARVPVVAERVMEVAAQATEADAGAQGDDNLHTVASKVVVMYHPVDDFSESKKNPHRKPTPKISEQNFLELKPESPFTTESTFNAAIRPFVLDMLSRDGMEVSDVLLQGPFYVRGSPIGKSAKKRATSNTAAVKSDVEWKAAVSRVGRKLEGDVIEMDLVVIVRHKAEERDVLSVAFDNDKQSVQKKKVTRVSSDKADRNVVKSIPEFINGNIMESVGANVAPPSEIVITVTSSESGFSDTVTIPQGDERNESILSVLVKVKEESGVLDLPDGDDEAALMPVVNVVPSQDTAKPFVIIQSRFKEWTIERVRRQGLFGNVVPLIFSYRKNDRKKRPNWL